MDLLKIYLLGLGPAIVFGLAIITLLIIWAGPAPIGKPDPSTGALRVTAVSLAIGILWPISLPILIVGGILFFISYQMLRRVLKLGGRNE